MNGFVKDDAEVFMILASIKAERKVVIGEFLVVCEFLEVYPNNISDLPPECRVEFAIDLVLGISPFSVDPCRMYALKLSKLKKQL